MSCAGSSRDKFCSRRMRGVSSGYLRPAGSSRHLAGRPGGRSRGFRLCREWPVDRSPEPLGRLGPRLTLGRRMTTNPPGTPSRTNPDPRPRAVQPETNRCGPEYRLYRAPSDDHRTDHARYSRKPAVAGRDTGCTARSTTITGPLGRPRDPSPADRDPGSHAEPERSGPLTATRGIAGNRSPRTRTPVISRALDDQRAQQHHPCTHPRQATQSNRGSVKSLPVAAMPVLRVR